MDSSFRSEAGFSRASFFDTPIGLETMDANRSGAKSRNLSPTARQEPYMSLS